MKLDIGELLLDQGCVMTADGRRIGLAKLEVDLLKFLIAEPDRVVPVEELLQRVWGYRPGVKSRTVYATVNRLRAKIERDPKDPRHLLAVPKQGYRFTPLVEITDATFHGRADELRRIDEALSDTAVVVLVGPGGAGKTRLARAWMGSQQDPVFCDASTATTARELWARIAGVVGATRQDDVVAALGTRGVLVLDNLEQLGEHAAPVLDELGAADIAVLATSRWMATTTATRIDIGPLDPTAAAALLRQRAATVGANLGDPSALQPLLGGWPLAIELAAGRLALLDEEQLATRLRERGALRVLEGPGSRHASIADALTGTWQLLADWERAAIRQLAVLPPWFRLEHAERVLAVQVSPLQALEALARRSVLRRERGGLRLLLGVRDFAMSQGVDPQAARRVDVIAAEIAARGAPYGERDDQWIADQDLLLEAWKRTLADADPRCGPLMVALARVYEITGPWDAPIDMLKRTLQVVDLPLLRIVLGEALRRIGASEQALKAIAPVADHPGAVAAAGGVHYLRGEVEIAEKAFARAIDSDDPVARMTGLRRLALLVLERQDLPRAEDLLATALAEHRAAGAGFDIGAILGNQGLLYSARGDHDAAEALAREAIEVAERHHAAPFAANSRANLGCTLLNRGQLEPARLWLTQAMATHRRAGNRRFEAIDAGNLARVTWLEGDHAEARRMMVQARAMHRLADSLLGYARATLSLGEFEVDRDPERARALLEEALADLTRLGARTGVRRCRDSLGDLLRRLGDLDGAAALLDGDTPRSRLLRAMLDDAQGRRTYAIAAIREIAALEPGPDSDLGQCLATARRVIARS